MLKRRSEIKGFQDGGMNVDPVSGNEVPTGSLPEEVRDDVDAKLSPGEFVIPADVVRFIGLERLMKMRDEAKKGIQRMSDIGQMGNAEEVGEESNSTYEDDGFESQIDDILGEVERENGDEEVVDKQMEMAFGGYVGSGTDITKAPKNPVFDVRYYKGPNEQVMFVTHINGKPMTPIPEGFKAVSMQEAQKVGLAADEAKAKTTQPAGGALSGQEGPGMESQPSIDVSAVAKGDASALQQGTVVSPNVVKGAGVVGALLGIPGSLSLVGGKSATNIAGTLTNMAGVSAGKANIEAVGKAFGIDTSTTEGKAAASSIIDSMSANLGGATATAGAGGTGGMAAAAASTAAAQAQDIGLSQSAIGQAAQAAANAVIAGTDPATAVADAVAGAEAAATGGSSIGVDALGGSPYAKGGFVGKRQYPTKKKKGKGIVASK